MGRPLPTILLPVALLLGAAASAGGIDVERSALGPALFVDRSTGNAPAPPAVAVGADGVPHVVYAEGSSTDSFTVHHAWREEGRWQEEVVPLPTPSGAGLRMSATHPLAVDAEGRLHLALGLSLPGAGEVRYALRDGGVWSFSTVAEGSWEDSRLYLTPEGEPRVVFPGESSWRVAAPDGLSWAEQSFGPEPIAPDARVLFETGPGGTLHLLYEAGEEFRYAVQSGGEWTGMPSGEIAYSIAVDAQGVLHAAGYAGVQGVSESLVHRWFDGESWQSEIVVTMPWNPTALWWGEIRSGPAGELFLLRTDRNQSIPAGQVLHWRDAAGWHGSVVGPLRGEFVSGVALAPDGALEVVSIGERRRGGVLQHLRLALPDLAPDVAGLVQEPRGKGARVTGTFAVRNDGPGKSKTARIQLYLSEDDLPDEDDEPVGLARRVRPLRPGASVNLPVFENIGGDVSGKRLLVVVDPLELLDDLDRPGNTAVLALGE